MGRAKGRKASIEFSRVGTNTTKLPEPVHHLAKLIHVPSENRSRVGRMGKMSKCLGLKNGPKEVLVAGRMIKKAPEAAGCGQEHAKGINERERERERERDWPKIAQLPGAKQATKICEGALIFFFCTFCRLQFNNIRQ